MRARGSRLRRLWVAVQRRSRGPQRVYAAVEKSDDAQAQSTDKRSAAVLSLFERAATPLGQVERAQAALAVANALVDRPQLNRKPARKVAVAVPTEPASLGLKKLRLRKAPAEESSAPAAGAAAPAPAATPAAITPRPASAPAATSRGLPGSVGSVGSPSAGLGGAVGGDAIGDSSSSPGPDFWSWVPPERQKAKKPLVRPTPISRVPVSRPSAVRASVWCTARSSYRPDTHSPWFAAGGCTDHTHGAKLESAPTAAERD
jgi:hypothetical protein